MQRQVPAVVEGGVTVFVLRVSREAAMAEFKARWTQ